jgi:hypothetical protein
MIGAVDHIENAFSADSTLIPARSRTSARIARFSRSRAASTTNAGAIDALEVEVGKGPGIAGSGFHHRPASRGGGQCSDPFLHRRPIEVQKQPYGLLHYTKHAA